MFSQFFSAVCKTNTDRVLTIGIVIISAWFPTVAMDECRHWEHNKILADEKYCPSNATTVLVDGLLWHECNLYCSHSSLCQAVNYDKATQKCSLLANPCFWALPAPGMKYFLFTGRKRDQCYDWIEFDGTNFNDPRVILGRNSDLAVAKLSNPSTEVVGYLFRSDGKFYAHDGQTSYEKPGAGNCKILRLNEGCTVMWRSYYKGGKTSPPDPWPLGPVSAGVNQDGEDIFVVMFEAERPYADITFIIGQYVDSRGFGYGFWDDRHEEILMELLLVL